MVQKREAYAPWSLTRKAGVQSATVNGDIEVPQLIQPVLDTGFVDEKGDWKGQKSSDEQFIVDATHESVANGGSVLSPQATPQYIDMTGFSSLYVAIRVSNAGGSHYAIEAVMGPESFANLTPVDAGGLLDGNLYSKQEFQNLFRDTSHDMTADVWNIMYLQDTLQNQKNLQFKITNNSGGASNIDFAYLRTV